jgi:predicted MFS family arabinose efflux permease
MIFAPLSSTWVQKWGNKKVVTTGLLLVATSFVLYLTFTPDSGILQIIGVTMLTGIGMANVLAPCTDSIMGSLPRAKAGVGSAVNDTTRQMGGAVGVAVFGSLMASHFTSSMTEKIGGKIPAQLFAQVKDNVGHAVAIATESPVARPFANRIIAAANDSFVSGLHLVALVAAGITVIAAIGVALFLPARAREEEAEVPAAEEPEPVAVS